MSTPNKRPILFSGAMVRAILEGRKTQTRRVVKDARVPAVYHDGGDKLSVPDWYLEGCPYGQPGDRLWVPENFRGQPAIWVRNHGVQPVHYAASTPEEQAEDYVGKPSIHMPRWASRITLEITAVRVERLQDISEEDCISEGIERGKSDSGREMGWYDYSGHGGFFGPTVSYMSLWESINGPGSWALNPWVWCISFRRLNAAEV